MTDPNRRSGVPFSIPRLERRQFLQLGGGLAAAALLAACGESRTSTKVTADSTQVAQAEAARRESGAAVVSALLEPTVGEIDLGGLAVTTWTYGGALPGKKIRVARGSVLRVDLRNRLPRPTSVHWHGVALRNDMDGVPDLTQKAIPADGEFRYEFTVPDAGTYWFHPHVGVQLDRGLYAPLVVEDPADGDDYDTEVVVVLDDWIDGVDGGDPDETFSMLQDHGMGGMAGMGGMTMPQSDLLGGDAGDVTYPHYLANGRLPTDPQVVTGKAGQRVRLRIINAAADTAFRVAMPGVTASITHTDGFPTEPADADAVLLGMGERVDAIVTLPGTTASLLAIAEGRDSYSQVIFKIADTPAPDASAIVPAIMTLPVTMATALLAEKAVRLPYKKPDVTHEMTLTGPAEPYLWTINGQPYDPDRGLDISQGQRMRVRFTNSTTMFHPMHVHGHTFQVRAAGGTGPRKDTAIVLPKQSLEVEFDADNPGQWLTHCHNVYHGEAGMMTVLSYVE